MRREGRKGGERESGMKIKVLGAYGSKFRGMGMTSFLIEDKILIDAGNVIEPLGDLAYEIDHIFITHHHLDHICDIPFLVAEGFTRRSRPFFIYAIPEVIRALKSFIFNNEIWPDFSRIRFTNGKSAVHFIPLSFGEKVKIDDISVSPVPSEHIVASSGFIVEKNNTAVFFSSDTYKNSGIWRRVVSENPKIKAIFVDVSYPGHLEKLGKDSKHLTTSSLEEEIKKLPRKLEVFVYHMKPSFVDEIKREVRKISRKLGIKIRVLEDGRTLRVR